MPITLARGYGSRVRRARRSQDHRIASQFGLGLTGATRRGAVRPELLHGRGHRLYAFARTEDIAARGRCPAVVSGPALALHPLGVHRRARRAAATRLRRRHPRRERIPVPHIEFDARAGETVYFMVGTSGGTTGSGLLLRAPAAARRIGHARREGRRHEGRRCHGQRHDRVPQGDGLDALRHARPGARRAAAGANGFAAVAPAVGPSGTPWSATLTSFPDPVRGPVGPPSRCRCLALRRSRLSAGAFYDEGSCNRCGRRRTRSRFDGAEARV